MRLTMNLKESFVRAAMADVPSVDYDEAISKVACEDAASKLPPKVRAVYADKATRHFVATTYIRIAGAYLCVPNGGDYSPSPEATLEVERLCKEQKTQADKRNDLRLKLRGCAMACTTKKQLVDMLPEFEKYLPEDEAAACRTLPVVTNVVADFVKAGWPKGVAKRAAA